MYQIGVHARKFLVHDDRDYDAEAGKVGRQMSLILTERSNLPSMLTSEKRSKG